MIEATRSFKALSEEFVEIGFRHDPVAATNVGIHDYDAELPNDTPEGFAERIAWLSGFEARLASNVDRDVLDPLQRVDLALLRSRIAGMRCDLEQIRTQSRNPVRYPETALLGVFLLVARPFAPLEERKEAMLARLMAIPDYLSGARACLDDVSTAAVDIASEVALTGPGFVDDVVRMLLRGFPGEAERIEHAGARARLGFLQYQDYLEQELRPRATGRFAIGEAVMNAKLEREHLLSMDCAALDELGRAEIERVRGLLEDEARQRDATRSWREQLADAKRRHPESLHLRESYMAEVERARKFVEAHRLAPMPDGKLEIVDTPVFERATTTYSAYLPPAPFDIDQTGYFFITPIDLSRRREEQRQQLEAHSRAAIPLIALHETWPGHHLQLLHGNRAGSRLRRLGDSTLFAEGWALYCEELMFEQGFFEDPATRLFQLRDLLWRACRVVLDVRLQTERITLGEAVAFLVENVGLERPTAEIEIKRFILRPTLPLGYLVGKKLLIEMRDEVKQRLGSRFDLHDFHAALLGSGTIPPALVREDLRTRLGVG